MPHIAQIQDLGDLAQQMNLENVVFETEIIEKRLLPVIQAPHHVVFPPRLFLRGNHGSPIKTRLFDTSALVQRAVPAYFVAGLFHRNSKLLNIGAIAQKIGRNPTF